MHLSDLKAKHVSELIEIGNSNEIEGANRMRKHDLIFALLKQQALKVVRRLFSQRARNQSIDLMSLLQCPHCRGREFRLDETRATCVACHADYSVYLPQRQGNASVNVS